MKLFECLNRSFQNVKSEVNFFFRHLFDEVIFFLNKDRGISYISHQQMEYLTEVG